ncbi:hypothetical protein J3Q64DRAFT_1838861 [Phycomyces blakesleeanus]|uniref:G-protein coupled receptors family 1 profile domain-containing protein n=2 Tax=Phycomyces blakesleeanus TaxID=4837 RepID=A0A167KX66_PHYB8|nr:hypothetical protein PHYBLDRAFT_78730 [Phycomyces blakesleeanus NRRL 1555(-)]OAD69089.1 hypothetical protein PHYBLDRAFT_78730 [Phycomyces blakesleeanus NRRL 1555(-)]|eukprot:XP_018287129.1 hypothetical protein PHYBLDRAFT_78730 [Phycomyces blakesleeanus NRRL 1555(-)]
MYFPDNSEIGAEVLSVVSITVLSTLFGLKCASIESRISYSQQLVLTVIGISIGFDLIACMLTSTNNRNYVACLLSVLHCTFIYTAAKIAVYLYFIEKIYILSASKKPRFRSILYIISLGLLLPHVAIVILMVVYRVVDVSEQFPFVCTIGYEMPASIACTAYEAFINLYFLSIFAKFIIHPNHKQHTSPMSHIITIESKRNFVGVLSSFVASCANYALMVGFDGRERGLVAMSISTADLSIVACIIFWISAHPDEEHNLIKGLGQFDENLPVKLAIKQHQEVVIETEPATHGL